MLLSLGLAVFLQYIPWAPGEEDDEARHWVGVSHRVSVRVLPQQEGPWSCQTRAALPLPARLTRPHSSRRNSPGRLLRAAPGPGPAPALGISPSKKPTAAGNSANVKRRSLGFSHTAVLMGKLFLVSFPSVTVTAVSSQGRRHGVSLHMYTAGVQHTACAWWGSLQTRALP